MPKYKIALLFLLSGVLFSISWYESLPSITLFIAFVPFLIGYDKLIERKTKFWGLVWFTSITFAAWTALATWWIYNASPIGIVVAIITSSLMMLLAFIPFHFTYKILGKKIGMVSFVFFWITYELFFHYSEVQWPWLTLGNGLGNNIRMIQWYEYTGVLGGSLWILIINVLFYYLYYQIKNKQRKQSIIIGSIVFLVLVVPIIVSNSTFNRYIEKGDLAKVLIIQPNIDPYNEKFTGMSNEKQIDIMLDLAKNNIDSTYDFVVCPETAIDDRIWEHELYTNPSILRLKSFVNEHPNSSWVTGIFSLKYYGVGDNLTPTARKYPYEEGVYYDRYNSSTQVDTSDNLPIYRKSKLVAGVEMMPYPQYMKFLEKYFVRLGTIRGSLGVQNERGVFFSKNGKFGVAPVICYESVFGEFVAGYINKGANLIFVITNDGWWGDTPGYHQHFTFSQIRAIEMRRSIARSANTGISAVINQRGEVLESIGWWKRGVIRGEIGANNEITYYARQGDYIGRLSAFLSMMILLYAISRRILNSKKLKSKVA